MLNGIAQCMAYGHCNEIEEVVRDSSFPLTRTSFSLLCFLFPIIFCQRLSLAPHFWQTGHIYNINSCHMEMMSNVKIKWKQEGNSRRRYTRQAERHIFLSILFSLSSYLTKKRHGNLYRYCTSYYIFCIHIQEFTFLLYKQCYCFILNRREMGKTEEE